MGQHTYLQIYGIIFVMSRDGPGLTFLKDATMQSYTWLRLLKVPKIFTLSLMRQGLRQLKKQDNEIKRCKELT